MILFFCRTGGKTKISGSVNHEINKGYRPNAHLLYIVMHYNGSITI